MYGPTLAAIAARRMFRDPAVVGDAVPAPAAPAKLSRRLLPGPAPLHAVRVRQGSCRRRRHAPCLAAPVVPLRYRVPACTGLVTRAATSRRADARHGSTRAKPSVVGDVKRPRHANALPILAATRLARSPVPMPASAAVTQAAKRCRQCERGRRGRQLVRQRLRLFARATVIRDANGLSPLPQDPGPSHLLLREKASKCAGPPCGTPRGRGVLVSLCPCRRPRRPRHRPRQQSCHGLCFPPRRSRALVAAHPRRVSREAASVVSSKARPAASSDSRSPCSCSSASRSLTSHQAGPSARLEIVWPEATFHAADWRLSGKRAQEKKEERNRCPRQGADFGRHQQRPPATHWTPAACRVCRPRNSESALRMPPPGEAARCRHVSHAARIAMPSALQAGRPVCRVRMSPHRSPLGSLAPRSGGPTRCFGCGARLARGGAPAKEGRGGFP